MADFLDTSISYYALGGFNVPGCLSLTNGSSAVVSAAAPSPAAKATAGGSAASKEPPAKPAYCVRKELPPGAKTVSLSGSNNYAKSAKDLGDLCKRRFFYRQAFDIYGGVAGFYTYGPPGCAVKNNLIRAWRQHFVVEESLLEVEDTNIMPHDVLKASGHVDRFNDFMVKDVIETDKFFRADKLLEEVMDNKLAEPGITEEQRFEYESCKNQADAYSKQEIGEVFKKYNIKSPDTGNDLSDPYEFNLMFPTMIGPDGYLKGYLRPETAQGIFLNYKFCCEQNSNRLPFGVAQVGKAFRNEIAPRNGLTRQREFTQAEIEYFVDPQAKAHPKFKLVADMRVTLFHHVEQLAAKEPFEMSIGEAVANGIVDNETLGYYMIRTYMFLLGVGIKREHCRFRQHLPTEMAHYAKDCWDAEIFTSYGWLECVGIADRSCFDLNAHAQATGKDQSYQQTLPTPIETEVLALEKKSGITVMKAFKKDGKMVKEWIEALPQPELVSLAAEVADKGSKEVEINGNAFTLLKEQLTFEKKKEKTSVRAFTPGVIEPSFGIDRIMFSILEHTYFAREPSKQADDEPEDKQVRGVLSFAPHIAPYKLSILPLEKGISRSDKYATLLGTLRSELSALGLSYTIDESGATIGRKYARIDELGVPFAVTMDKLTMEDDTVTLRSRDAMDQRRLPLDGLALVVRDLISLELTWADVCARFPGA
mmetsp:Transcript_101026/g.175396  ORF Transcript_101026/g.175396 Transcript_101026/m.175396 type:complete len:706 (-) Transcript_101026:228-2345(-)